MSIKCYTEEASLGLSADDSESDKKSSSGPLTVVD